LTPPE